MKYTFTLFIAILLMSTTVFGQTFDIYVSDGGNYSNPPWQVLKFDENGENEEVFINEELAWPQDILFLEEQGVVLISNLSSGRITKYNADDGTYLEDFATDINGPTRMKIGADGLLYVLQWGGNGRVLRYQLDGTFEDEFTDEGVPQSIGLDWDTDGNLYVSSYTGNLVQMFDTEGEDMGTFISSSLQGPTNIWFDEDGDLLAANWNGSTVGRFDSDGVFVSSFLTGLANPEGVAIYPNGDILIGNGGTSSVKLFDADGNYIEDIISSGAGGLILPNAVVLREVSTVGTTSPDLVKDFVQPSIGSQFFLNETDDSLIESVMIHDLSGRLIEQKTVSTNQIWDASEYPDGVYFITAELKGGERIVQKLLVKK